MYYIEKELKELKMLQASFNKMNPIKNFLEILIDENKNEDFCELVSDILKRAYKLKAYIESNRLFDSKYAKDNLERNNRLYPLDIFAEIYKTINEMIDIVMREFTIINELESIYEKNKIITIEEVREIEKEATIQYEQRYWSKIKGIGSVWTRSIF